MAQTDKSMTTRIAKFIAESNKPTESFIGYCGSEPGEIESAIQGFDFPVAESFFLKVEHETGEDQIIGLLGFDIDSQGSEAEVWGPFSTSPDLHCVAEELWEKAKKGCLAGIHTIHFFPEVRNTRATEFALSLGAIPGTENSILVLGSANFSRSVSATVVPMLYRHTQDIIRLHDALFPTAYLSGQQIVDSLDDHHAVFVVEDDRKMAGYIFAEANPQHAEATIHFFGVASGSRGQGYGRQLLTGAINWIFSFSQIREISLCVEAENGKAIGLYRQVGFEERHRCLHLKIG